MSSENELQMLIIRNGKVFCNGVLVEKDIVIDGGKITAIATTAEKGGEMLDARGKIVLPGLIDAHVHFREPGETHKEDFLSGSRAAAAGGVTTVLDMPNNKPPITSVAALEGKRELAKKSIVNYGFHFGATEHNIREIGKAGNIAAVKTIMGATTGSLLVESEAALERVFGSGRRVIVHAEDGSCIRRNEEKYRGSHEPSVHAKIRSPECASIAVARAVWLAAKKKARLHVAHVSTEGELRMIAAARKNVSVTCEVTPHHLFLTTSAMGRMGNFAKMNPPLRGRQDAQAMWEGIRRGVVDIIATDHAPHTAEEKQQDYWDAPSGVPGVETMLPLLLDAVSKKKLPLQQLVRLTAENPARIFGLRGKGGIAVGMDADIVLVDMKKRKTIKNSDIVSRSGWTPFDGRRVKGVPVVTVVHGRVAWKEGEVYGGKGREVSIDG